MISVGGSTRNTRWMLFWASRIVILPPPTSMSQALVAACHSFSSITKDTTPVESVNIPEKRNGSPGSSGGLMLKRGQPATWTGVGQLVRRTPPNRKDGWPSMKSKISRKHTSRFWLVVSQRRSLNLPTFAGDSSYCLIFSRKVEVSRNCNSYT